MGINCPSCGGKMVFDITNQCLVCGYCDTRQTIEEYKANNEAEEQKMTYDTVVYTCRNCGAELTAPDEQAVAYCSYCGSEQMLTAKHEELLRPKRIIPFKKSKQQAKNEYEKALKGKFYVPKEFKDPKFLEGFRGIYLPYFSYSAVIPDKELTFKGSAHYTKGNYDYSEDYDVFASVGGHTQDVDFDASASFDDTLANSIAPFEAKDMQDFNDAYLAGFYADKATTSEKTYMDDATELAADTVYKEIEKEVPKVNLDREKSPAAEREKLGISAIDCDVSFFPVWFLTWRHKNRVAYSVMNGQTGKITMDIPVNKKMFFLVSLIIAVILFAILSILPMFLLPKTLASLTGVILVISGILLNRLIRNIYEKESHIYDYGDTQHTAKKKRKNAQNVSSSGAKTSGGKKSHAGTIVIVIAFFCFVFFRTIGAIVNRVGEMLGGGSRSIAFMFVVCMLAELIFAIITIKNAARLDRKAGIIPPIISVLVLLAGVIIGGTNPPHDYWYYGLALACLVAVILNAISCINYFNYLTTRPVPNFFRREGADNA